MAAIDLPKAYDFKSTEGKDIPMVGKERLFSANQ